MSSCRYFASPMLFFVGFPNPVSVCSADVWICLYGSSFVFQFLWRPFACLVFVLLSHTTEKHRSSPFVWSLAKNIFAFLLACGAALRRGVLSKSAGGGQHVDTGRPKDSPPQFGKDRQNALVELRLERRPRDRHQDDCP